MAMLPTPFHRSAPMEAREDSTQVALIEETTYDRDLRQIKIAQEQELFRAFDAFPHDPSMRRYAG